MSNRTTTTHTIRLRPIDRYFFGGEAHYEGSGIRQYFHRSNPYPQQTALLGMLRHQLLIQQGLMPLNSGNHDEAADLIGETGFGTANTKGYGIITRISSLRWLHGGKVHDLRPFDWLMVDEQPQRPTIEWGSTGVSIRGAVTKVPVLRFNEKNKNTGALENKPWIAKTHFANMLSHGQSGEVKLSEVIADVEQVGIHKDRDGKPKEEGYFKFVYQRMKEDWAFVFSATFYDQTEKGKAVQFDTTKRIITMGAERSAFELEVLPSPPNSPPSQPANNGSRQRVLLISDAIVPDEGAFYQLCELPLSASTPFKHIESRVKEKRNYADLPARSGQYHLLKRGSVFYTQQAASLTEVLEGDDAFRNIGYNHFIIENP